MICDRGIPFPATTWVWLKQLFSVHAGLWATDEATDQALDPTKAPIQGSKRPFRTIQPEVFLWAASREQPWSPGSWEWHKPTPPDKPPFAPSEPGTVGPLLLAQVWQRFHEARVWRPRLRPLRPWFADWKQRAAASWQWELKPAYPGDCEFSRSFVN